MYSVNIKAVYFLQKENTNFIYILFIFYDFVLIYRPPELVKFTQNSLFKAERTKLLKSV